MCKEAKRVEMESGGVEQVDVMLCYHYLEAALLWALHVVVRLPWAGWSGWLVWISG